MDDGENRMGCSWEAVASECCEIIALGAAIAFSFSFAVNLALATASISSGVRQGSAGRRVISSSLPEIARGFEAMAFFNTGRTERLANARVLLKAAAVWSVLKSESPGKAAVYASREQNDLDRACRRISTVPDGPELVKLLRKRSVHNAVLSPAGRRSPQPTEGENR